MEYAMAIESNSTNHLWNSCRATTLRGAKCETTRRLRGSAHLDDTLIVAEMHRSQRDEVEYQDTVQYRIVATRGVWAWMRWVNVVD